MIEIENKKEEPSKFLEIKEKIKETFFRLYYELNNEGYINIGFSFILMTFSFFNIFSYCLSDQIGVISEQTASYTTIIISDVFNIAYFLKHSLETIRLSVIVIFFCLALVILTKAYLVYEILTSEHLISKSQNNLIKLFIHFTLTLIFWVFFMPMLDINLQIFVYDGSDSEFSLSNNISTVILSILNIFFIFVLGIMYALIGNKSLISSVQVDGLSRADCDFEMIYLMIRALLVLCFFLTLKFKIHFIYYIILNAIISLFFIRFNYSTFLYYNQIICKLFNYLLYVYFWDIVCVIIITASPYKDPTYILLCGKILILPISNGILQFNLKKIVNETEYTKLIHTPYKADIYLKHINLLITNQSDPLNRVILSGITDSHYRECPNEDCIIKRKDIFFVPSINEFMMKEDFDRKSKCFNLVFLLSIYKYYLKNSKHLVLMNSYLNYQFEEIGNLTDLFYHLYTVDRKDITIQQDFSFYRILYMAYDRIEEEFTYSINDNDNTKFSLDLKTVVEYYTLVNELKLILVQCGNSNYSFWNSFIFNSDNTPVYDNGLKIFQMNQKLDILYSKIKSIYTRDKDITSKYSEYIRLIRGDERLAQKYFNMVDRVDKLDDIKSLEKINSMKEFFFGQDSVIVIASFSRERSVIEKITESVSNVFGYTSQQILGKEVETLLSPYFRQRHSTYVNFHFETGIKRVIGKERNFYGYSKNHLIFPIKILVMILPNLDNKMLYMASIQKLPQPYGVLLVNPKGKIDSISEKLSTFLGIPGDAFIENELYIYYIIASYFYEIGENGKHITNNIDLKNFHMKVCENRKMIFCTEKTFIDDIKKTSRLYDFESRTGLSKNTNSNMLHKKFLDIIQNEMKDIKWPRLDTEIVEETYNNGFNPEEDTLFIVKVYNEDDLPASTVKQEEAISRKGTSGLSLIRICEDTKIVKNLNDYDEKHKFSNVKKIFVQKKNLNESMMKKKEIEREGGSSLGSSMMTSSFYTNYSNFRKKLQKSLNEEVNSNFAKYTGWVLLVILIISSLIIHIIQVQNINSLQETYSSFSTTLSMYDDLNCLEKNMNSVILRNYQGALFNLTFTRNEMYRCLQNNINDTNNVLHIYDSSITSKINMEIINANINLKENTTSTKMPLLQYLSLVFKNIITLDSFNFSNQKEIINLKLNFQMAIYSLFKHFSNTILSVSTDQLNKNSLLNSLYLLMRLCVIFLCFIIIVPILIVKKSDQLKILETFFQIKPEDAESQRENCREYLSRTTNIRIEENDNEEKVESVKEIAENQVLIEEKKKRKKKDKGKGKDKDKEKEKEKDKGNKNNSKKTKSFSSNGFTFQILSLIILLIMIISIVPIINFFYEAQMQENSKQYIDYKLNVDNYAFAIERIYIETQSIFVYGLYNYSITPSQISFLKDTFTNMNSARYNFSDFILNSKDIIYFSDLDQLLNGNLCDIFVKYGYQNPKCVEIESTMAQKGLTALLNEHSFYITQFQQEIINNNQITTSYVNSTLKDPRWVTSRNIFDIFVLDGFNIILTILKNSYINVIQTHMNRLYILFVTFIVILVVNQLVVWLKIERKIQSMETDTYKLFSILPLRFISEYNSLSDFLKKITQDVD